MVHQNIKQHDVEEVSVVSTPTWAKIVEPVVAIAILWVLTSAACNIFA